VTPIPWWISHRESTVTSVTITATPLHLPAAAWRSPDTGTLLRARDVAALLRLAQRYTGASQARVAAAIDMTQSRANEVINGKRSVCSLDVLERIAAGLSMPDGARMLLGLAPVLAADVRSIDDLATGVISRTYTSQVHAASDIRTRVPGARSVDVLAVRGLGLLALNDSLLRALLSAHRREPLALRVALLAPDGPAARQRADEVSEDPDAFATGIRLAEQRLAELAELPVLDVAVYRYERLPVWRLLLVDETLFAGAFDADWEGHESPMYRLEPASGGALYRGLRRSMDDLISHSERII
jgi:predicted XRE-type DNA-binding protein